MAMTETRPADAAAPAAPLPADPPGLAGWLATSDHKRVGRLFLGTSLLFLLVGGVLGALVGAERVQSGIDIVDDADVFGQLYSLHAEAGVLLFLLPFLVGLATYLVPLQVGSPEIAFPRGSATAYWGYLVGGALLCASYVADGGATGGTDTAVDLYLLSLGLLAISLALGLVSAVTTVLAMRTPGMTLMRTPLLSWSVLAGGGITILSLSILVARVIGLFVGQHFSGEIASYGDIAWFWSLPAIYGLVVIVAGVALEIVPVLSRAPLRFHVAGIVVIGLLTVVGVGGWAVDPESLDDLLYVAIGLAAVLPALALLGLLGDTARGGSPSAKAPLVLALGAVLLLLAGAAVGALQVIDALELLGTTWESGQLHLVLWGAGGLGAFAALWFWAPKIWGAHLDEKLGYLVALLLLGGAVLLAVPDLVNGMSEDQPLGATEWESDTVDALNGVAVAGAGLSALGALVGVGAVLMAARKRDEVVAADDPWGGFTLEWSTTSPPPLHNFTTVAPVTSATPLRAEEVS
jgi:cytochrome c oxidase subunit 1